MTGFGVPFLPEKEKAIKEIQPTMITDFRKTRKGREEERDGDCASPARTLLPTGEWGQYLRLQNWGKLKYLTGVTKVGEMSNKSINSRGFLKKTPVVEGPSDSLWCEWEAPENRLQATRKRLRGGKCL